MRAVKIGLCLAVMSTLAIAFTRAFAQTVPTELPTIAAASRLTSFEAMDVPLKVAAEALAKSVGVTIRWERTIQGDSLPLVHIQLIDVEFAIAFRRLMEPSGLAYVGVDRNTILVSRPARRNPRLN